MTFLIIVIWFFIVLPWLFRRVFPPVLLEPPAPPAPAITVLTPRIVVHVHLAKEHLSRG
jgi:hypothetical protein